MPWKFLVCVLGVLSVVGVVHHLRSASGLDAMDTLLEIPANSSGYSEGGISQIDPRPPLSNYAEPGRHTVIVFYTDGYSGCTQLRHYLRDLTRLRPDVAIKYVDLTESWGGAEERYDINITSVPHVIVFDSRGREMARDDGNDKAGLDLLTDWINAELQRDWKQRG